MTTQTTRKIVRIDEEKCTGCGACILACAEGALKIIDGKARLVSDRYCDGLGACLDCPEGAISIEEREAEAFDEAAAEQHVKELEKAEEALPCGCASATVEQFDKPAAPAAAPAASESRLGHWPVQLTLVPPAAPFLKDADVVLVGDCVPFAYGAFHRDFLEDKAVLVACPKLDDFQAHQAKLTQVMQESGLKSLTVVHMEVPCCSGLVHLAKQAMLASGNSVPFSEVTISARGERLKG